MATRLAHQLPIVTDPNDVERYGIEPRQHIEVKKTVVEWGHQRIGDRMSKPHQVAVVRGRIDHHKVMAILHCGDGSLELGEFGGLVFVHSGAFGARDAEMGR